MTATMNKNVVLSPADLGQTEELAKKLNAFAAVLCCDNNITQKIAQVLQQRACDESGALRHIIMPDAPAAERSPRGEAEEELKVFTLAVASYRFLHPGMALSAQRRHNRGDPYEEILKVVDLAYRASQNSLFRPANILQAHDGRRSQESLNALERNTSCYPEGPEQTVMNLLLRDILNTLLSCECACFSKSPLFPADGVPSQLRNGYYTRLVMSACGMLHVLFPRNRRGRFDSCFMSASSKYLEVRETDLLSLYACPSPDLMQDALFYIIKCAHPEMPPEKQNMLPDFTRDLARAVFKELHKERISALPPRCVAIIPVSVPVLFDGRQPDGSAERTGEGGIRHRWFATMCIFADGTHKIASLITTPGKKERQTSERRQFENAIVSMSMSLCARGMSSPFFVMLPAGAVLRQKVMRIFHNSLVISGAPHDRKQQSELTERTTLSELRDGTRRARSEDDASAAPQSRSKRTPDDKRHRHAKPPFGTITINDTLMRALREQGMVEKPRIEAVSARRMKDHREEKLQDPQALSELVGRLRY